MVIRECLWDQHLWKGEEGSRPGQGELGSRDACLMMTQLTSQGPLGSESFTGQSGQNLHIPPWSVVGVCGQAWPQVRCLWGSIWGGSASWGQQVLPWGGIWEAHTTSIPWGNEAWGVKSPTCPGQADKDQSRDTCSQMVLEHECRPAFYPGCLFHDVFEGIAQANHPLIQVVVYLLAFHIISQNMYWVQITCFVWDLCA